MIRRLLPYLLALASGLAIALAFPRMEWWPLAWVALVPLLAAAEGRTPRTAFFLGLVSGFAANVVGFFWMNEMLVTFGHLPKVLSVPIVALGAVYQALTYAAALAATAAAARRFPSASPLVFPLFFTAFEAFHPILFPWYLGNCQYPFLQLIQVADLFGISVVTFLVACGNVALYAVARRPAKWTRTAAVAALPVVAALGYGAWRLPDVERSVAAADRLKLAVVEPEIGIFQEQKKEFPKGTHALAIFRYNTLQLQWASADLAKEHPDLIVWPESMYFPALTVAARTPASPEFEEHSWWIPADARALYQSAKPLPLSRSFPEGVLEDAELEDKDVNAVQRGFATPLLFGATSGFLKNREDPNGSDSIRYNSAFAVDETGTILGRYDKQYLLAFGEYIPLGETFPFLYDWIPEAGHFSKGPEQAPIRFRGRSLGVLICYEDIIASHTRAVVEQGAEILLNMTNDAWFGKTQEAKQHFILALFRSIEHRRTLVRATTTGISGVVLPTGEVSRITRPTGAETFVEDVPLMQTATVYNMGGCYFPHTLLAISLALLAICIRTGRRRCASEGPSPRKRS